MEGPYRYRGTLRGEPVSGFAFYERSLALYRDWELIDVLASAVENLSAADRSWLMRSIRCARSSRRATGHRRESCCSPCSQRLPADSGDCRDVIDALITVLSADS